MKKITLLFLLLLLTPLEILAQYDNLEFKLKNKFTVSNEYSSESNDNVWKEWIFIKTATQEKVQLVGYNPVNTKTFSLTTNQQEGLLTDDFGNRGLVILTNSEEDNSLVVFKVFVDKRPILIDMTMEGVSNVIRFTVEQ